MMSHVTYVVLMFTQICVTQRWSTGEACACWYAPGPERPGAPTGKVVEAGGIEPPSASATFQDLRT